MRTPVYRRALIAAAETDPQRYPNLYSVGWPELPPRDGGQSSGH